MTVLICAAHPDDEVIGCGGTIAKLAKKEKVIVVIFSYGSGTAGSLTSWPPFMSEEKLRRKRIYEANKAGIILGVHKTLFLDIISDIDSEFDKGKKEKLLNIIKEYRPGKIFYHSFRDVHPHHHSVNKIMREIISELDYRPEVYTYQVNVLLEEPKPKLVYDISKEFHLKIKALFCFKSQIISIIILSLLILFRGYLLGKRYGFKFAECFYGE